MGWDGMKEGWPSPWALDPPKVYDEWHLNRDRIRARLARLEELRLRREKDKSMTDYITKGEMPTEGPRQAMRSGPEGTEVLVGGIPNGGVGRADLSGPLGNVRPEQAGILPMRGLRISDEMVARACVAHPDVAPEKIRAILEVGLSYSRG